MIAGNDRGRRRRACAARRAQRNPQGGGGRRADFAIHAEPIAPLEQPHRGGGLLPINSIRRTIEIIVLNQALLHFGDVLAPRAHGKHHGRQGICAKKAQANDQAQRASQHHWPPPSAERNQRPMLE